MPNTLQTTQLWTYETLRIITNNLKFAGKVYQGYSGEFGKTGFKVGNTINIRVPSRFIGATGTAVNLEALTDTSVPLTLTTQFNVGFQFSSSELAVSLDDIRRRYLAPAGKCIANKIDADGLQMAYQTCPNVVGTPGTAATTQLVYLQAGQKMNEAAAPLDEDRTVVLSPSQSTQIVNGLSNFFNSQVKIGEQYEAGRMGTNTLGFADWYIDQNVATHTTAVYGGTPVVNGANQTGSSLITNGWTATTTTFAIGDNFTIAGVFSLNPQTRKSTGQLQQFSVTGPVSADASGNITFSISPPISPLTGSPNTNQFANVTNSPAAGAAITVYGPTNTFTSEGIGFHREAFTLASVDLDIPGGVDMSFGERDPDVGVFLRFVRQYVATSDQWINRFDVLYGYGALYPSWACRIVGN